MPRLISIYNCDYLWPDLEPHFDRSLTCCEIAAPGPDKCNPATSCAKDGMNYNQKSDCERAKIQGPEVRTVKCPTPEELEYNETDACLKKLFRKHPELLAAMKKKPTINALKKFNFDRFTTTYECDFGHKSNPTVDYDGLPKKRVPCPLEDEPTEEIIDCRPSVRTRRELLIMKMGLPVWDPRPCKQRRRHRIQKKEPPAYTANKVNPWTTEYRDKTTTTAHMIIKQMTMNRKQKERAERAEKLKHSLKF